MTWRETALSSHLPPGWWDVEGPAPVEALRVCLACPALAACGRDALAETCIEGDTGVRAASTAYERRGLRNGTVAWPDVWARARERVDSKDASVSARLDRWFLVEAGEMAARRVAA